MQRMELSFIAKAATNSQAVVAQGQSLILKIVVVESTQTNDQCSKCEHLSKVIDRVVKPNSDSVLLEFFNDYPMETKRALRK